jgi:hypothetical protein
MRVLFFSSVIFFFIRPLQSKFFWFVPLGARNLHFLNRSEQNNRFKKWKFLAPKEENKKNLLCKGLINKNYREEKQNSHTLQGDINLFTLKNIIVISLSNTVLSCHVLFCYVLFYLIFAILRIKHTLRVSYTTNKWFFQC